MSLLASFSSLSRVAQVQFQLGTSKKMTVSEDIHELKHKQTFKLSCNQELIWVALENVGETPAFYCTVCHKFESKVDKMVPFLKGTLSFRKTSLECNNKSRHHLAC